MNKMNLDMTSAPKDKMILIATATESGSFLGYDVVRWKNGKWKSSVTDEFVVDAVMGWAELPGVEI
jgi:hypothetical protein